MATHDETETSVDERSFANLTVGSSRSQSGIYKLPSELWTALAEAVYAIDEDIADELVLESDPPDGAWTEDYIKAFALTCNQAYAACIPFLFARVDMAGETVEAIDRYIVDVLPRRAELVTTLWFRVRDEELDDSDDEEEDDEDIELGEDETRWLSKGDGSRQKRFKQLLTLLLGLPNLREANFDVVDNALENELLLKAAIVARASTLNDLQLDGAFPGVIRASWLAGVVRMLPQLEQLAVTFGGPATPFDDTSLAEALNNAPRLRAMDLDLVQFLTPTFADTVRLRNLQRLDLHDPEELSWTTVEMLLHNIGSNLRILQLEYAPGEDMLGPGDPLRLPKLERLRLAGNLVCLAGLERFKTCPLIELAIGPLFDAEAEGLALEAVPDPAPLSEAELCDVIRNGTFPDLRRLELVGSTDSEDSAEVREACEAREILYHFDLVLDSDSESEEDDGFDDNLSEQSWQTEDDDGDVDEMSDGEDLDDFGE